MKKLGNVRYNRFINIGPEVFFLGITFLIIIAPAVISFVFDTPAISWGLSPVFIVLIGVFLFFTVFFLVLTSFSDPGYIIPITTETPPVDDSLPLSQRPLAIRATLPGDSTIFISKYCHRCMIYRAPGVHHCRTCDACTRKFDHHCVWTSKCIGERNYRYFLWFLVFLCLHFLTIAVTGYLVAFLYADDVSEASASLINAMFVSAAFTFPFILLCFHLRLIFLGLSTYDHIYCVPSPLSPSNKWSLFCINLKLKFCSAPGPSYLNDPSSIVRVCPVSDEDPFRDDSSELVEVESEDDVLTFEPNVSVEGCEVVVVVESVKDQESSSNEQDNDVNALEESEAIDSNVHL
ncbi:hypothetical protein RCL1_006058 [Eukaryota sp. TZLM3-RCL]